MIHSLVISHFVERLQAKVDQSRQESMSIVSNNREKSKQAYAERKVEAQAKSEGRNLKP